MLADELDYVLGVDTHRDEHVMAVVTAPAASDMPDCAGSVEHLINALGRNERDTVTVGEHDVVTCDDMSAQPDDQCPVGRPRGAEPGSADNRAESLPGTVKAKPA